MPFRQTLSVARARAIERDAELRAPVAGEQDVRFLQDMIEHHQAAIDMSSAYLDAADIATRDPRVAALAEDIITAQSGEVARMQLWLGVLPSVPSDGM